MLIHYFRVHMPAFLLLSIAPYWLFIFLCASKTLNLQLVCPQGPKTRVSRGLPTSSSCSHGTTRNTRRHVVRDTSLHHHQPRTIPAGEGPSSVGIQDSWPVYDDIGYCDQRHCYCGAAFWYEEWSKGHSKTWISEYQYKTTQRRTKTTGIPLIKRTKRNRLHTNVINSRKRLDKRCQIRWKKR